MSLRKPREGRPDYRRKNQKIASFNYLARASLRLVLVLELELIFP
jgi:hypothetical protein